MWTHIKDKLMSIFSHAALHQGPQRSWAHRWQRWWRVSFPPLGSQKSIPSIFPWGSDSRDSCFMVPRLVQFHRHEVSCFTEVAYRWEFHSLYTTGARLHWTCWWFKTKSMCPSPLHRLALHTVLHVQQHTCHIHCNSPAKQNSQTQLQRQREGLGHYRRKLILSSKISRC